MDWLQATDIALFRLLNDTLSNPVLDVVMPFLSGNSFFIPLVILLAGALLWKGGARGFLFVFVLLFIFILGDVLVINTIKHAAGRARPYLELPGVHLLAGKGDSGSMPSSHTSTWFAATLIAYVYYRRSLWFMLPLAMMVGLSRIYVGVHYPSDVLAGAVLGAGYAAAGLWSTTRFGNRSDANGFPNGGAECPR